MTSAKQFATATLIGLSSLCAAGAVNAQSSLTITPMAEGLEAPWGVAPRPGGGLLVTEKAGRLIYQKDGARHEVSGLPEVAVVGQGGLLDITLAEDFAQSRLLFLTYAKPQEGGGAGTALASARRERIKPQNSNAAMMVAMAMAAMVVMEVMAMVVMMVAIVAATSTTTARAADSNVVLQRCGRGRPTV